MRVPFLISVGEKLYVHFSEVTQKQAMEAHKGHLNQVFDQLVGEIRKTDRQGLVEVHGQLVWGSSMETISLSEYKLMKKDLR